MPIFGSRLAPQNSTEPIFLSVPDTIFALSSPDGTARPMPMLCRGRILRLGALDCACGIDPGTNSRMIGLMPGHRFTEQRHDEKGL